MQDYPSYTRLNSYDLKALSNYQQSPTVAVRQAVSQWPAQQPVTDLAKSELRTSNVHNEMSGSVMDCLMPLGLIMFLLLSSSVLLGFTADRLARGMIMLIEHQAKLEVVVR